MAHATRALFIAVMFLALISASGCATKPPTPEEQIAVWLTEAPRTLSISISRELPEPILRSRDYKAGERINSGVETGVKAVGYGILGGCKGLGPLGCIVGVLISPLMFTAGAIVGAAKVDSVDSVHSIDATQGAPALFEVTTSKAIDLPSLLAESVVVEASASGRRVLYQALGNKQDDASPKADGELQLVFRALEFFGEVGEDPRVALVLRVSANVRTPDAESLEWGDFAYEGSARSVSAWRADDALLFQEEVKVAVHKIATQIANKLGSAASTMALSRVSEARSRAAATANMKEPPSSTVTAENRGGSLVGPGDTLAPDIAARSPVATDSWTSMGGVVRTEVAPVPGPVALTAPSKAAAESPVPGVQDSTLPAAGTTWIYRLDDRIFGRGHTEVVIRVENAANTSIQELVTTGTGSSERVVRTGDSQVVQLRLGGSALLVEVAPYLLAGSDQGASLQLQSITGYPQGPTGLAPWRILVTRRGWEQVRVSAGGYRALRVEIDGERERQDVFWGQDGRFSIVAWYALEVKRLIKLEHKTWETYSRRLNGHWVLELTSFSPPS